MNKNLRNLNIGVNDIIVSLILLSLIFTIVIQAKTIIFGVQIDIFRILLLIFIPLWIIRAKYRDGIKKPSAIEMSLIVFTIFVSASIIWTEYTKSTMSEVLDVIIFVIFALIVSDVTYTSRRDIASRLFESAICFMALFVIPLYLVAWIIGFDLRETHYFLIEPIITPIIFVIVLPFAIRKIIEAEYLIKMIYSLVILVITMITMIIGSRSGLISLLLVSFAYLLFLGLSIKKVFFLITCVSMIGVVIFTFRELAADSGHFSRIQDQAINVDYSSLIASRSYQMEILGKYRTAMYHAVGDVIREFWLLGVGYGGYREYLRSILGFEAIPHNFILRIWVGAGIVPVIITLYLLRRIIVDLRHTINCVDLTRKGFFAAIGAGFVGQLALGLFNPMLSYPFFYFYIGLIAGLVARERDRRFQKYSDLPIERDALAVSHSKRLSKI